MDELSRVFRAVGMEIILLAFCVALAFAAPGFFSTGNLLDILRSVSMQGIIAFGMTMVIISGEIDLSVGSAVAFSAAITAWLMRSLGSLGLPSYAAVPLACAASLALGFGIGCVTGILRIRFRIPSFISTLALMTGLSGLAFLVTNGFAIVISAEYQWFDFLGAGYVWKVPFPAILLVIMFAVFHFLMNYTPFGRSIYAIGGNAEAARLSGIKVGKVRILVFGITTMLAAASGILAASQQGAGAPTAGRQWELDVIAAVIIGGTSLSGGSGRIWGTMVGVMFLGVILNGLTLLNVNEYWQLVVRGLLIVSAVLINQMHAREK